MAVEATWPAALSRLLAARGVEGPVLYQCRVGASEQQPQGCWQLFLTRLPAGRDLLGAEAQLALEVARARRSLHHLVERRPSAYAVVGR